MKNIVLIGMMGCGKSTCAALLAKRLGRGVVDIDALIEARAGQSIPDIFATQGEGHFRALEVAVAQELGAKEGLVVACGGGLPTQAEAMEPLAATGTVIFLHRDPGQTYDAVSMAGRPLGQGSRADFLERFAQRLPLYRQWAQLEIASRPSPEETVAAILEGMK